MGSVGLTIASFIPCIIKNIKKTDKIEKIETIEPEI
jgi:hypothetical protein